MEEYTEYCLHYRNCGLRSPKRRFNLDRSRLPIGAPHEQGMLDPSQADSDVRGLFGRERAFFWEAPAIAGQGLYLINR